MSWQWHATGATACFATIRHDDFLRFTYKLPDYTAVSLMGRPDGLTMQHVAAAVIDRAAPRGVAGLVDATTALAAAVEAGWNRPWTSTRSRGGRGA